MTARRGGVLAAALMAAVAMPLRAQDTTAAAAHEGAEAVHHAGSEHGMAGTHRITLGLGHTNISQGRIGGDTRWLATASWSLNYDYWLANRWAVGLQSDVVLEQFVIEHGDQEQLERKYPVSIAPVALFKATKLLTLVGGVGVEYASGEAIGLTRLGLELGWHVGRRWEVGGALVWDNKWGYYNSWAIAFSASRLFGGNH